MKKSVFCIALIFITCGFNALFGQNDGNENFVENQTRNTEPYLFYLTVNSTTEPFSNADTIFGLISIPYFNLKLKPNASGSIAEIYSGPEQEIRQLGSFTIIPGDEDYWYGMYELNEIGKGNFEESWTFDAIVALEVEVPYRPYRSIFFEMFRNGVEFTDVFDEPIYSWADILEKDSKETEQHYLDAMLEDVRFTAGEMRKSMDSPMIEGGRYGGNDLFSAMEKSTTLDVRSFLRYVEQRPVKYRGQSWKISETYATWLVSESPVTGNDMMELLAAFHEDDNRFNFYISDTNHSVFTSWLAEWRDIGEQEKEEGRLSKAKDIFLACLKLSNLLENNEEAGWSCFAYAQTFPENEAEQSKKYYELAVDHFNVAEEKAGLIAAQNNLGYILNDLKQYVEAQEVLENAYALEMEVIPDPNDPTSVTVALTLRNLGNSFLGQRKYKKALDAYEQGLKFANQSQPLSLKRKAAIYFQMAETYQGMGKDEDYDFYTELAVATFLEYEEALKKGKKM